MPNGTQQDISTDATDTQQIPGVPAGALTTLSTGAPPAQAPATAAPASVPAAPATTKGAPGVDLSTAPGSFGHKLASALQFATTILKAGQGGLADAAHATDNLKPGQGGLTGAENVLAARQQRLTEQARYDQAQRQKSQEQQDKLNQQAVENKRQDDRNHALNALSNIQMVHETGLTQQLGLDNMDRAVKSDTADFNSMIDPTQPVPAQALQKGIPEGQLKNLIQTDQLDGYTVTAHRTGMRDVGTDPITGLPQKEFTYSVLRIPDKYTVPQTPAGARQAARWSSVAGEEIKPGQVVSGAQANWYNQQANNLDTLTEAANKARDGAELVDLTNKQKTEQAQAILNLNANLDWMKTLNHFGGQEDLALDWASGNGKLPNGQPDPASIASAQRNPNIVRDVMMAHGGPEDFAKVKTETAANRETERHNRADEALKALAIQKKTDADVSDNTDAFGNHSGLSDKEFNKRYDSFSNSAQMKTLGTLQQSNVQFQNVLRDINSTGDMSGAQSVVALFDAVGISATPLAGKGFRINNNVLEEHVGARGIAQAGAAKLLKLKDGDVITPDQVRQYAGIAQDVYKNAFVSAANEQLRQLGYTDVLPRGNNQTIDPVTHGMYLQIAGNDPVKAAQAERKQGWSVTVPTAPVANATPAAPAANAVAQPPQPTTHVFNPAAWSATHPGQDVNAAIAFAKSKGFQVKQ